MIFIRDRLSTKIKNGRQKKWAWMASFLVATSLLLRPAVGYAIGDQAAVDINRFHPAPGTGKMVTVDVGQVGSTASDIPSSGPRLEIVPQFFLHYAYKPLIFSLGGRHTMDDGTILPNIVTHQLIGDFSLSFAFARRFQISLTLPVAFYQVGDSDVGNYLSPGILPPPPLAVAGPGDLRIAAKGVILDTSLWGERNLNFGVAILGDLAVPTGNANSFLGSLSPTFNLRLIGSLQYKRFSAAINFGGIFMQSSGIYRNSDVFGSAGSGIGYGLQVGNGLTFGVAAQVELLKKPAGSLFLITEVFGTTHYPFENLQQSPAELSLALKASMNNGLGLFLGGGPGLNYGYGTPIFRLYGGVSYAWHQKKVPPPPPYDACLNLPGIQPSVPSDLVRNEQTGFCLTPPPPHDECPNIVGVQPVIPSGMIKEEKTGFCIIPKVPPPPPPHDECPNIKGAQEVIPPGMIKNGAGDCVLPPPPPPPHDECPNIEGAQEVIPSGMVKDAAGRCLIPPPRKKIPVTGQIYFEFNKDRIKPQSYSVLNGVLVAMLSQPKVVVRVDGHTDAKGNDMYNIDLSQRRSKQVVLYMSGQIPKTEPYASRLGIATITVLGKKVKVRPNFWIDAARLTPLGFGKTCPAEKDASDKGRQLNRRVEFTMLEDEEGVKTSTVERCDVQKMDEILKAAAALPKNGKVKVRRGKRR